MNFNKENFGIVMLVQSSAYIYIYISVDTRYKVFSKGWIKVWLVNSGRRVVALTFILLRGFRIIFSEFFQNSYGFRILEIILVRQIDFFALKH